MSLEDVQSAVSKGVAKLDRLLVGWANPLYADKASRPHAKWALHSLDGALVISVMYLLFVAFALTQKTNEVKTKGASKKKKEKKTVAEKYAAGPILFICMALYNLVQAVLCVWMVVSMVVEFRARGFTAVCNVHDPSAEGVARVLHVFYLSKVLDFADTVFMVVKGNWRQLSFLHVYHHSSIFLVYWLIVNTGFDGDIYLTVVLNGIIHAMMYSYYLATTFNVEVPVAIKMMITNSQLIQFVIMLSQGAYLLSHDCAFPTNATKLYVGYIASMFTLFMGFRLNPANYAKAGKKKQ